MLTFDQIKELIDLVTERRLQGVEIERSGFRLRIDGRALAESAAAAPLNAQPASAPRPEAGPPPAIEAAPHLAPAHSLEAPPETEEGALPDGAHILHSPIVGTFYSAPSPDASPYVTRGDGVKKGQVLCIVEAMKLMNEIESDVDGKLLEIYPKNAQPVEYGEPLFAIQPD